mmetsp:Transcript_17374/g.39218  ORF Transcript_17374/g.39218 Transcript_17374/m.39218 type:complete len:206 (-) Transcript_17374:2489-3106(-)
MFGIFNNELSRNRCLCYNKTKYKSSKNFGPEHSASLENTFIHIEMMMGPQEPGKKTKQCTGNEHQRRQHRIHHRDDNDQHILCQYFMKGKPSRIIDGPHPHHHGSFFPQGGARTEERSYGALQEAHDAHELHAQSEKSLHGDVGDEKGGHFGEGGAQKFEGNFWAGDDDGHGVENGSGDGGDQEDVDDLKEEIAAEDFHLHLREG